jgi:hypothetical protein
MVVVVLLSLFGPVDDHDALVVLLALVEVELALSDRADWYQNAHGYSYIDALPAYEEDSSDLLR